ncbi:methyl-accepting chemotaxis protein [Thiopseudomonas denitrificans]|uniref:Methyl-accepting chemotaxis protein n=1 Tax=Thiopseudomonas denitrificans TaxID=1501432 RepID=A0A4R6TZL2_9GAMM|nr:methyl-accepting chemotaxis protein [Thiopseudomonas denitrificans]TDQ39448.1 methyl-accepting chemotaxis protein [Thiopseudomonas denitrificans]
MKNLKVMTKLAIGFGAVVLLLATMSISNLMGLNHISERGKNLDLLYEIEDGTIRLQQLSNAYQIDPDIRHLESTATLVNDITGYVREVTGRLTLEQSRIKVGEVPTMAQTYYQAFQSYADAQRTKADNVKNAVELGYRSDDLISRLNPLINGPAQRPVLHDNMAAATAGRLSSRLLTARKNLAYQARGYLMTETPEAMQVLETAYSDLQEIAQQLQASLFLTPQASQLLDEVITSTAQYMAALRDIPALVSRQDNALQSMNQTFNDLYTRTLELTSVQSEFMNSEISKSTRVSISLSIVAILLAILIAWLIARQITQPLEAAVRIAQSIGNRDMTGNGVEQRSDEFGTLLRALDTTRSNLRDALGEVNGVTTQLAAAAEELSVVTGQTSAGVNAQRVETEQVATAMNEMAATVHEVAQNSEEAAQAAQKADQQAQSGNKVLQTALDAISRLSGEVQESAQAMYRLNENSANISTVLTVINGIAEQTNLLALNAAIEAARAGEAGRGFAVVADEVRGLAHRTQESTAQIEELIATLQKGAQDAVEMMDSSSSLAGNTLELAQQAGGELAAITRTVSEIQAMNMQIATAAEEQSSVAEEINRSVINVNNIADQSAAAVEEMAASSADLARLGQALQDLVTRFKV